MGFLWFGNQRVRARYGAVINLDQLCSVQSLEPDGI
jgi:hypothetical protein